MRIVGIDPGLQLTGYGVIDPGHNPPLLIDGGVIRLSAGTIPERLLELRTELAELLTEHRPEVCAVEQLYAHYKHPRTAILMGHARGVILMLAQEHHCRIVELAANRVKQSVSGHGHASKGQMQRAIMEIWKLKEPPEPPDVADALAIAYSCAQALTEPR